jgi:hypothetical protein
MVDLDIRVINRVAGGGSLVGKHGVRDEGKIPKILFGKRTNRNKKQEYKHISKRKQIFFKR